MVRHVRQFIAIIAVSIVGSALGCGGDTLVGSPINADPATLFARVRLNHHAVTLSPAPYDTLTLAAQAYSASGALLQGTAVRFTSGDTVVARVTPDGRISTRKTDVPTWVYASITIGNITHADSAYVIRLSSTPVVTGFSVAPLPGDSAVLAAQEDRFAPAYLTGTGTDGVIVAYEVADTVAGYLRDIYYIPTNIDIQQAFFGEADATLVGRLPGAVRLRASATINGVEWRDSVTYTVGIPTGAYISFRKRTLRSGGTVYELERDTVYVPAGGYVNWFNSSITSPISIQFEDPSLALPGSVFGPSAQGGDIAPWTYTSADFSFGSRKRQFMSPGTIRWRCPELDLGGVVIVRP